MDGARFDDLTRSLAGGASRRRFLARLGAGLAVALALKGGAPAGAAPKDPEDAAARCAEKAAAFAAKCAAPADPQAAEKCAAREAELCAECPDEAACGGQTCVEPGEACVPGDVCCNPEASWLGCYPYPYCFGGAVLCC